MGSGSTTLEPLTPAGVSRVSTSSFNDAAQMDAGSAVELVVQLTNGRQFPTGLFVASAACLSVAEEADLRRLPDIGAALAKISRLEWSHRNICWIFLPNFWNPLPQVGGRIGLRRISF